MQRRFGLRFAAVLWAIWFLALGANDLQQAAQAAPATSAVPADTVESLRKKRQLVADQIARLQPADKQDSTQQQGGVERVESLKTLDGIYLQHRNQLDQQSHLETELKEDEARLAALEKFDPDEPKPYSFLLLENLKDQLAAEKDRQSAIEADTKSSKQLLKAAHDELDAVGAGRAAPAEKRQTNQSDERSAAGELTPERLPYLIARARVSLRQAEIEVITLRLKLCENKQKQLTKKIEVIEKDVKFSADDRDRQFQRLAETEATLKRQRHAAESGLQDVDAEKQTDLKQTTGQKQDARLHDAIIDGWRIATAAYQSEIVALDSRIDELGDVRDQWKHRYAIASGTVEVKKMADWLEQLDELRDELKESAGALEHRIDTARDDQAALAKDAPGQSSELVEKWRKTKLARLTELRELCGASLDEVKSTQRVLDRFRAELSAKLSAAPKDWATSLRESVKSLFGYQISDGEDASVSMGQLLLLVVLIAAGVAVSWLVSRLIRRSLLRWFNFHPGTVSALKSMVFYVLCIVFGAISFHLLHVPTTAFAFMGGAAAIAIGFGGQDIMNNFMSGIILLAEQPIRVGDVVELEGTRGVVLHIGLRSTRLQTQTNYELIVPNHSLLDSAVTNLTLSDNFVQTFVTIGADRDIDVQKSKRRMLEIAFAHPLVMKSPRPAVLMTEVDTYWITFQIHFWLEYSNYMRIALVQSEILEQISDLFKPPPQKQTDEPDEHATTAGDGPTEQPSEQPTGENGVGPAKAGPPLAPATADLERIGSAIILKQMKRLGGSPKFKAR